MQQNTLTPGSQAFIELVRAKAERALLQQAKDYTADLHELLLSTQNCQVQLRSAKARMLEIATSIHKKLQEFEELEQAAGLRLWNPLSEAVRRRGELTRELKDLTSLTVLIMFQRSDRSTGTDRVRRSVPRRVPVAALLSSPERGAAFAGEPRGRKPSGRAGTWPNSG
jgi:hypothetical protein